MKKIIGFSFCLFLLLGLNACLKDATSVSVNKPNLPAVNYNYTDALADVENLPFFDNTPDFNKLTDAGAKLGRVLFFDENLSLNNRISCGTCHKQALGFADELDSSVGFEGKLTARNTPQILNMRFSQQFFWDMSTSSLEEQVLMPVVNHIEMGMEDLDYLSEKLSNVDYYPPLFEEAFGAQPITSQLISNALSQFIRSINSFDSKFDIGQNTNFENFNALENHGKTIFLESGCNSCHRVLGDSFGNFSSSSGYGGTGEDNANIGLDMIYEDQGIENGIFKIPSLRNLIYTAPYMHDGRFATLDEVVDHYDSGVQPHSNLDFRLKNSDNLLPRVLNLNQLDREGLKAFLLTLTDDSITKDEKLSDPFKN